MDWIDFILWPLLLIKTGYLKAKNPNFLTLKINKEVRNSIFNISGVNTPGLSYT